MKIHPKRNQIVDKNLLVPSNNNDAVTFARQLLWNSTLWDSKKVSTAVQRLHVSACCLLPYCTWRQLNRCLQLITVQNVCPKASEKHQAVETSGWKIQMMMKTLKKENLSLHLPLNGQWLTRLLVFLSYKLSRKLSYRYLVRKTADSLTTTLI